MSVPESASQQPWSPRSWSRLLVKTPKYSVIALHVWHFKRSSKVVLMEKIRTQAFLDSFCGWHCSYFELGWGYNDCVWGVSGHHC